MIAKPSEGEPALHWGLRASFVSYVTALGHVEVGEPASEVSEGLWSFPLQHTEANRYEFAGEVRLSAHEGLLRLTIRDPWLTITPGVTVLSVADALGGPGERIEIARVVADGQTELAEAGAALFEFRYPVGSPLEQLRLIGIDPPWDHSTVPHPGPQDT